MKVIPIISRSKSLLLLVAVIVLVVAGLSFMWLDRTAFDGPSPSAVPAGQEPAGSQDISVSGSLSAPNFVSVSAASSCGPDMLSSVSLVWNGVGGSGGYRVYRNATPDFSAATRIGETAAGTTSFSDSGRPAGTVYYWVTAFGPEGESRQSDSRESVVSCPAADLSATDTDVVGQNGKQLDAGSCDGFQAVPGTQEFRIGDTVKFRVVLCNTSPAIEAGDLHFSDTLINLARADDSYPETDPRAWRMAFSGGKVGKIEVSGWELARTLGVKLPGAVPKAADASLPGTQTLTFEAKIQAPASFVGELGRFQHRAVIGYDLRPGDKGRTGQRTVQSGLLYFVRPNPDPEPAVLAPY